MPAFAVDIVLLPPDEMLERAISLNRALPQGPGASIVLSQTHCLPHVSLAMGCVAQHAIPSMVEALIAVASASPPIDLTVIGLSVRSSQTGEPISSVELARDLPLRELHEAVLRAAAPFFARNATPEMFVDSAQVAAGTLDWVNRYETDASFDRFWPHVTLGMGTVPAGLPLPGSGRASRLAICHLGPHCTCRRILAETALGTATKRG